MKQWFQKQQSTILTETIPNVAIFFTSYEHLNDSYEHIFRERFTDNGMLRLIFARFFGTLEFCDDLNFEHENIGLFGIALQQVAHRCFIVCVFFLQYKNNYIMDVRNVSLQWNIKKRNVCKNFIPKPIQEIIFGNRKGTKML